MKWQESTNEIGNRFSSAPAGAGRPQRLDNGAELVANCFAAFEVRQQCDSLARDVFGRCIMLNKLWKHWFVGQKMRHHKGLHFYDAFADLVRAPGGFVECNRRDSEVRAF